MTVIKIVRYDKVDLKREKKEKRKEKKEKRKEKKENRKEKKENRKEILKINLDTQINEIKMYGKDIIFIV